MEDDFFATSTSERFSSALNVRDPDTPESIFARNEDRSTVRAAISGLTPAHRELIRLRYDEELTIAEIAQRQGVTEIAVHQMHKRAIGRIKSSLGLMGLTGLKDAF